MTDDDASILIVSDEGDAGEGVRTMRGGVSKAAERVAAVDVSVLRSNVQRFLDQIHELVDAEGRRSSPFKVKRIQVSAQISAEGKVALLGSGAKVGTSGTVQFILERDES